jgi:hypothetical protein
MTPEQEEYRMELSRAYVGDARGFLAAECEAMMRGKLPMAITEEHQAAWLAESVKPVADFMDRSF